MNTIGFALVQCFCIMLIVHSQMCKANEDHTLLAGGATLTLSEPLTANEQANFGPGWKVATYVSSEGEEIDLFPTEAFTSEGGVIFDDGGSPRKSPTGKYAVIDVLRAGIVTPGASGKPEIYTRQYCPVLEAKTGCVLSVESGSVCAGQWGRRGDRWIVPGPTGDMSSVMLKRQFHDANTLWSGYVNSIGKPFQTSIRDQLSSTLGIGNLMACDRLSANNIAAYRNIAMTLNADGDGASAEYIERGLREVAGKGWAEALRKIVVQRAFLFDKPGEKYQSKMYLIEGDDVRIIGMKGSAWLKVEYVKRDGRSIRKWIRSESVG